MIRILLAVDGSENAMRAVDYVIRQHGRYKDAPELHLVNAQPSLRGNITMFVPRDQVKQFHDDEGEKAIADARKKLDKAGIRYVFHIGVGEPAAVIDAYARDKSCDEIIIGTRGMGSVTGLVLGSVASKVVHLADRPVLLVK